MENTFIELYRKIHRRIFFIFDIFWKNRKFNRDINYKSNFEIEKCFENRIDPLEDDKTLLKRISYSYKKSSHDLLLHSEIFRPSNEWLPIYNKNFIDIIRCLEKTDLEGMEKIYKNFWRESCSLGLVGLPVNMKKSFFGKNINYVNKMLYLNDAIHRFNLWNKLLGNQYTVDKLISPSVGNPYGYFIDGKFIKSGSDYQHYYATMINDLIIEKQKRKVVAEIGGGYGGMAYYLIRDAKNTTYIDFDLPENLALTTYYLLKSFPEKKFFLYGDGDLSKINLADFDIILMPSFQLDKLPENSCDLLFNSYSLAEMSYETINHYVLRSSDLIKLGGWFFHVNHTKQSLVSANDFPIPNSLSLISENLAEWNLGRNSNMDEYEFIYKKITKN